MFSGAPSTPSTSTRFRERFAYQTAHLPARAAWPCRRASPGPSARDAAEQVATRARAFSHGNATETRNDPQILEIVGRIEAAAFAAEAVVAHAAEYLQRAYEARDAAPEVRDAAKREAELAVARPRSR